MPIVTSGDHRSLNCESTTGCIENANARYLGWVERKHRHQKPTFVRALVNACGVEFAAHAQLSDDQRAEIYSRVRDVLQRDYDARLRRHARCRCCS
jgi:hypothetical protein